MSKIKTILAVFATILLCCLLLSSSRAQTSQLLIVNHVATDEQEESLALDVFFTIMDENGRPIPNPNIESATIELLGPDNEPVPATVSDPESPIYITLLIDGSTSMMNVIGDVRAAAQSAIDNAPPTAHFSVIQFHESSTVLESFTNDHSRVKSAISIAEAVPEKGTCLYDALYDAVNMLDDQIENQQARRAIILFTDGKDQLLVTSDERCSKHTYDDVINVAKPANITAPTTPIHTIGLFDEQGGNINDAELRRMAEDTVAFSAIGNSTNLNSLFQDIIDGLNSQLVAQANVYAAQGENQAVLSVKVRDVDAPLATTFNFVSKIGYDTPPPPVGIRINNFRYDEDNNTYSMSLSAANSESIHQLIINVWDERRGTQVGIDQIFENPAPTEIIELDASAFEVEREYTIHIEALDADGLSIMDEDGDILVTEKKFIYEPDQAGEVEFSIVAVTPKYNGRVLLISLNVPDINRVQTYDGLMIDSETGEKIASFGETLLNGTEIQEKLPEEIINRKEPRSYRVIIYLTTDESARSEGVEFEFTTDEPPKWWEKMGNGLRENPEIIIGIIAIGLCIAGYFFIRNKRKKKNTPPPVRPPINEFTILHSNYLDEDEYNENEDEIVFTTDMVQRKASKPRLQLKVTHGNSRGEKKVIAEFPCSLGRNGCDMNIKDQLVSREHVNISLSNNKLSVTDMDSRNGSFLDDRKLVAHTSVKLSNSHTLRLGSKTVIELQVLL